MKIDLPCPQKRNYPEHIRIFQVCLRVPLGNVDQVRVLGGVPDKEGRRVETSYVQDALFGLQFDGDTIDVTRGIS